MIMVLLKKTRIVMFNHIRYSMVLPLIICFFCSTCVSGKMEIFCDGELVNDIYDYAQRADWREFVLPEGGVYEMYVPSSRALKEAHLPASEIEALGYIWGSVFPPPDCDPSLFVQISKPKKPDGRTHIEAICITFQELLKPPVIQAPYPLTEEQNSGLITNESIERSDPDIVRIRYYIDAELVRDQDVFFKNQAKFPQLRHLELYSFTINDKNISNIFALTNLEYFGLPYNCSDEHLKAIGCMKKLKYLNASGTRIKGTGLKYISELPDLQTLDIRRNQLVTGALSGLKGHKSLETLLLSDSSIKNEDLKDIADSNTLKYITLHNTGITDDGLLILSRIKNLKYASLYDTPTTKQGLDDLKSRCPGLIIDNERPRTLSKFLFARRLLHAYTGDKEDQLQQGWNYYNELGFSPIDLVEALKWFIVFAENDNEIHWLSEKWKKLNNDGVRKGIKELEKQLDQKQIHEARRRAQTILYLQKITKYEVKIERKEGLSLYQYKFRRLIEPQ